MVNTCLLLLECLTIVMGRGLVIGILDCICVYRYVYVYICMYMGIYVTPHVYNSSDCTWSTVLYLYCTSTVLIITVLYLIYDLIN